VNIKTATLIDDNNNKYLLHWDRENQKAFSQEMLRYLKLEDSNAGLPKEQSIDRTTLESGDMERGMSKEHILLSCGFPPEPENPMEEDIWFYWVNSWKKCAVYFEGGVVVKIVR
jgi:hypothetical protein